MPRQVVEFAQARDLSAQLRHSERPALHPDCAPDGLELTDSDAVVAVLRIDEWSDSLVAFVERSYDSATTTNLNVTAWSMVRSADAVLAVMVQFSGDVGASVAKDNLQLSVEGVPVDMGLAQFAYDAATRTARWEVPAVPEGTVTLEVPEKAVTTPQGTALDGDSDGRAGGAFLRDSTMAPEASVAPPRAP